MVPSCYTAHLDLALRRTKLRQYTVQFGRCVVDLWSDLTSTAHGQPALPRDVPSAQASFQQLPECGIDLGYAQWERCSTICAVGNISRFLLIGLASSPKRAMTTNLIPLLDSLLILDQPFKDQCLVHGALCG